ncbi:MAG TPA: hydrolase 2, exosortase A system-associated [Burkholderiaceae bacterium]
MNAAQAPQPAAFFLPGRVGPRFCLYHAPAAGHPVRGAFLYIHPFAEEMNCARRTAARQARRLAADGYGVLQIDLGGCGDSHGEFAEATWQGWRDDVLDGAAWLSDHCSPNVNLWGLRMGALLALDCCTRLPRAPEQMLLWQPVINGRRFLNQFLRIALASKLTGEFAQAYTDSAAMRVALIKGDMLEIGGYELSGGLAGGIDAADAALLPAPLGSVQWLEISADGVEPGEAAQRLFGAWRAAGVSLDVHLVTAPPFWATHGHEVSDALLDASVSALLEPA